MPGHYIGLDLDAPCSRLRGGGVDHVAKVRVLLPLDFIDLAEVGGVRRQLALHGQRGQARAGGAADRQRAIQRLGAALSDEAMDVRAKMTSRGRVTIPKTVRTRSTSTRATSCASASRTRVRLSRRPTSSRWPAVWRFRR